jgi:hypothetical protein
MTDIAYTCLYWDWLRGRGPLPDYEDHGLTLEQARRIQEGCYSLDCDNPGAV